MKHLFIVVFFIVCLWSNAIGQVYPANWPPDSVVTNRVRNTAVVGGALYVGGMLGLYQTWYKQHSTGNFHFFNDATEWEGMDKLGHSFTTYTLSNLGFEALNYSGVSNTQSTLYSTGYAMLFQTTVEVFDGYSAGWGFSWGDMAANTVGAGLFALQQLTWQEQRLVLKMSYSPSSYAQFRPNLLGRSWNERMLKDYNGQTYWLSANIKSFLSVESRMPGWVNITVGYGADGMIGGHQNPKEIDGMPAPNFDRIRQYYLSADIDFLRIQTRSKFLKTVFIALSWVKIPFPAIEVNSKGNVIFHPIHF